MQKEIKKLNKAMKRNYFFKHYGDKLTRLFITTFMGVSLVIALPVALFSRNTIAVTLCLMFAGVVANLTMLRKIDTSYLRLSASPKWREQYKAEAEQMLAEKLFERKISKNAVEGYYVYTNLDKAKANFNNYVSMSERKVKLRRNAIKANMKANKASTNLK